MPYSRPTYEVEEYRHATKTKPITVERAIKIWGLNFDKFTGRAIAVRA